MTERDLTAAVEAAAAVHYDETDAHAGAPNFISYEQMLGEDMWLAYLHREAVLGPVEAAAPHIEAAALRRAAEELRAERMHLPAALLEAKARKILEDA